MKLLTKQEIQQKTANARKLEIDEGKKLAQSVDNLRELRSLEEQNLEKFREKTVSAIHKEIEELSGERDSLVREVKTLEDKREEARKPLDEEWGTVRKRVEEIDDRLASISIREEWLKEREEKISSKETLTKREFERADASSLRASQLLKSADSKEQEASKCVASAKAIEESAILMKDESIKTLLARENAVALRESSMILQENNAEKEREELAKEWRLLEDRKALFERNKKRLCL